MTNVKCRNLLIDEGKLVVIECHVCFLSGRNIEDVIFEGLLVTYQKDSKDLKDSGLRFIQADKSHFECPKCGARVKAQIL